MALNPIFSMLREISLPGNDSRNRELVGYWQDVKGEFFGGGCIEIRADGTWKPHGTIQQRDIMASYMWRQMTPNSTEWVFLQVRQDPRDERIYIVARNGANLSVRHENLRWCLEKHDPERSGRIDRLAAATENLDVERRSMREARRNSLDNLCKEKSGISRSRSISDFLKSVELLELLICLTVIGNSVVLGWLILAAEDPKNVLSFVLQGVGFVLLALLHCLQAIARVMKWRDARGTGWLSVTEFLRSWDVIKEFLLSWAWAWDVFDVLMVVLGFMEMCFVVVLHIVPLWRILVILECVEVLRFIRLFHLLRISKKWLHLLSEAMQWLLLSACLLLLLLYIFGVLCTRFIGHSDRFNEHHELQMAFHTLGDSMFTLFSFCTFEDWTEYLRDTMSEGPYGVFITVCMIAFMFVSNLTIFNVAAAAMVQLQDDVNRRRRKRAHERKEDRLRQLVSQRDHEIERDEFFELLKPLGFDDEAFSSLEMTEVFNLIDADKSGKLSPEELLDGFSVLSTSSATSKQLFSLDKKMHKLFKSMGFEYKDIAEKHRQTHKTLDVLHSKVQKLQDEMAGILEPSRGQAVAGHMSTEDKCVEIQQDATCESIARVSPPSLVSTAFFENILDSFKRNMSADLEALLGHYAELSDGRRADEYHQLLESIDTRLFSVGAVHEAAEASPNKFVQTCSCPTSARNGHLEAQTRITDAGWIPSLHADIHCGANQNRVAHTDVVKQDRLSLQSFDVSAPTSVGGSVQEAVETSSHEQDDSDSRPTSARNSLSEAQCRGIDAEGIPPMHAEIYCGGTPHGAAHTDVPKQHRLSIQSSDVSASAPLGVAVHVAVGPLLPQLDETNACPTSAPNSLCDYQLRRTNVEGSTSMQAEIHCGATQNWLTHTGAVEQYRLSTQPSDVSTCAPFGGAVHGAVGTFTHKQSESHSCPTSANYSFREAQSRKTDAVGVPSMQTEIHCGATRGRVAHTDVAKQHRLSTRPSDISVSTSLGVEGLEAVETSSPHKQGDEHACPTTRNSVCQALSPRNDARDIPSMQADIHCGGASKVPMSSTKLRPLPPPLVSISPANQRFTMELDGAKAQKFGEGHRWHHSHSSKFVMTPPLRRAAFVGPPRRGRTAVDLGFVSPPHVEPNWTSSAVIALAPFVGPPDSFGHTGRIAGLEKWVSEHCLSALPLDKLVLHLDAQGVQLSTVEQDYLNYALSHRNLWNTELWP